MILPKKISRFSQRLRTIFHATVGSLSFLMVSVFFIGTIATLFFYSEAAFIATKDLVLQSFWTLIPILLVTAAIGIFLGKGQAGELIQKKKLRMVFIIGITILILLPIAFFLDKQASAGDINSTFYFVQGLEIIFDIVILVLMGLNFRDGSKLVAQHK